MDRRSAGEPAIDKASPASHRRRRIIGLSLTLVTLVVSYAVLFADLYNQPPAGEQVFAKEGDDAHQPLNIYFEVLSMDPVRQAMQIRLDFATNSDGNGAQFDSEPRANMFVQISDGYDIQDLELQAGVRTPSSAKELDVSGRLENYPVDRYVGKFLIRAFEGTASAKGAGVPIRLTTWDELGGWRVAVTKSASTPDGSGLTLNISVDRNHAQIFFALLLYGAMVLIGGSALTIASLSFVGTRKIEATLVSALGAMVFAVPALRNIMPGAPPLGVRADAMVFLWVQLTVIVGLTVFVATWAHRGPRP